MSDNNDLLASAGNDQIIRLWDVTTGKYLKGLKGHQESIWSIAFSKNNKLIASASEDETIKIWNINSGKCINTLKFKKLYENMNIFGTTGLTIEQEELLLSLGAVKQRAF